MWITCPGVHGLCVGSRITAINNSNKNNTCTYKLGTCSVPDSILCILYVILNNLA